MPLFLRLPNKCLLFGTGDARESLTSPSVVWACGSHSGCQALQQTSLLLGILLALSPLFSEHLFVFIGSLNAIYWEDKT